MQNWVRHFVTKFDYTSKSWDYSSCSWASCQISKPCECHNKVSFLDSVTYLPAFVGGLLDFGGGGLEGKGRNASTVVTFEDFPALTLTSGETCAATGDLGFRGGGVSSAEYIPSSSVEPSGRRRYDSSRKLFSRWSSFSKPTSVRTISNPCKEQNGFLVNYSCGVWNILWQLDRVHWLCWLLSISCLLENGFHFTDR